jgi:outer membrane protein OmpA-like peptidoglycan-associated protein
MMRPVTTPLLLIHLSLAAIHAEGFRPKPINPGPALNSVSSDFAPAITEDGRTLYFNSKRDGRPYQDIFVSEYGNGRWSVPRPVPELNSPYNDETPFITPSGDTILFASDRDESISFRSEAGVKVTFDIYISYRKEGGWSRPVPIPGNINSTDHERAPSLSPDGKRLYYTSYPFGGDEESIIVTAQWDGAEFQKGKPLPSAINSGNGERGFLEAEDGFYFSSKRAGGFGGWDLYYARLDDGLEWSVMNLGALINSEASEFYFIRNRRDAYFCSDRKNGLGHFDIYAASFSIPATHFRYDSAEITQEASAVLVEISRFLSVNPLLRFEIVGHTDLHGTDAYNRELSLKRAQSVKDHLIRSGIMERRLTVRGAGMSEPLIDAANPEADQKNRRTEFRLLGFSQEG